MAALNRQLKIIKLMIGSTQYEMQLNSWTMNNNTDTGDRQFTFAPDGEFVEEVSPDYSLTLKFFSDFRLAGISDYLWANDGATVAFQLDHHYDIPAEYVRWTGSLVIKAPNTGGDARTTEITEIELPCVGKPIYLRP